MKLNKNQRLFSKLIISLLEQMYEKHNNTLSELCDPVRNANKEQLINELSQIMFKYNIDNTCMNISKVQQMKLYKELCSKINEMFGNEFNIENNCISDILSQTAKDSYYINSFVTSMGISYTLKPVSNKILQEIINHKIEGKLWSDRLWDDKVNLRKDLKLQVKKFLNGEINVNNISNVIEKKYKNNRYITNRLVNNEISIVQEGANDVWRKEHNIKNMLYMGTLDRHICSNCAQYDGKIYEVGKQPVDLPQHVGCRCTYVNIPSADWRPQERLDNETKQKIDWQTYEEWYKLKSDNEGDILNKVKSIFKNKSQNNVNDFTKKLKDIPDENTRRLLQESQMRTKFEKSTRRSSYYSSKDRTVYLKDNIKLSTIAHELFHEIDHNYKITSSGVLSKSLENDYLRLQNMSIGYGKEIKEMLEYRYSDIFHKNDFGKNVVHEEYRGISDIIHGMTNGKIDLGYGHRQKGYWERDKALEKETWAQYGRMLYENNNEVLKILKDIFPNTTNEISKIIREVGK